MTAALDPLVSTTTTVCCFDTPDDSPIHEVMSQKRSSINTGLSSSSSSSLKKKTSATSASPSSHTKTVAKTGMSLIFFFSHDSFCIASLKSPTTSDSDSVPEPVLAASDATATPVVGPSFFDKEKQRLQQEEDEEAAELLAVQQALEALNKKKVEREAARIQLAEEERLAEIARKAREEKEERKKKEEEERLAEIARKAREEEEERKKKEEEERLAEVARKAREEEEEKKAKAKAAAAAAEKKKKEEEEKKAKAKADAEKKKKKEEEEKKAKARVESEKSRKEEEERKARVKAATDQKKEEERKIRARVNSSIRKHEAEKAEKSKKKEKKKTATTTTTTTKKSQVAEPDNGESSSNESEEPTQKSSSSKKKTKNGSTSKTTNSKEKPTTKRTKATKSSSSTPSSDSTPIPKPRKRGRLATCTDDEFEPLHNQVHANLRKMGLSQKTIGEYIIDGNVLTSKPLIEGTSGKFDIYCPDKTMVKMRSCWMGPGPSKPLFETLRDLSQFIDKRNNKKKKISKISATAEALFCDKTLEYIETAHAQLDDVITKTNEYAQHLRTFLTYIALAHGADNEEYMGTANPEPKQCAAPAPANQVVGKKRKRDERAPAPSVLVVNLVDEKLETAAAAAAAASSSSETSDTHEPPPKAAKKTKSSSASSPFTKAILSKLGSQKTIDDIPPLPVNNNNIVDAPPPPASPGPPAALPPTHATLSEDNHIESGSDYSLDQDIQGGAPVEDIDMQSVSEDSIIGSAEEEEGESEVEEEEEDSEELAPNGLPMGCGGKAPRHSIQPPEKEKITMKVVSSDEGEDEDEEDDGIANEPPHMSEIESDSSSSSDSSSDIESESDSSSDSDDRQYNEAKRRAHDSQVLEKMSKTMSLPGNSGIIPQIPQIPQFPSSNDRCSYCRKSAGLNPEKCTQQPDVGQPKCNNIICSSCISKIHGGQLLCGTCATLSTI